MFNCQVIFRHVDKPTDFISKVFYPIFYPMCYVNAFYCLFCIQWGKFYEVKFCDIVFHNCQNSIFLNVLFKIFLQNMQSQKL